jgi:Putative Flp pilus-assembly TadE/G-like
VRLTAEGRRGQTLPFWTLSIAASLTLLFFLTNYANTVRWGIRAQNAADSAASAGIATDANVHNQIETLQFAATVDETRMRYLIQAIVNTVDDPAGCGNACDAYYASLVSAYNTASNGYGTITHAMQTGDNLTEGGLKNSPSSAIGVVDGDCTLSDCAFTYTTAINSNAETVDVVACKKVPYFSPALFGLGSTATFTALGRSVQSVEPLAEAFVPGSINPTTGQPYQPDESPAGANVPADYVVSFKNETVNLTWYVAGPLRPAPVTPGYGCS